MKRPHRLAIFSLVAGLLPSIQVAAQSIPAGVSSAPTIGFQLPTLGGSYSYGVDAGEFISTGFYGSGVFLTTDIDGDLAYMSSSASRPFSAAYTGGVLIANSGQPTTTYQELSLSQGLRTKNWNFEFQDGVSYMPESPGTGFSGIPGVGDLGIDPIPVGPASGLGILTTYGPRVSNTFTASAGRSITARVSAQATGYYSVQRFIGDYSAEGVDNNSEGGSAGVSYHFNSLSALTLSYNYSYFGFVGTSFSYTAQGGTLDYSRQWTRRFGTDAYIGPQYITSSGTAALFGPTAGSTEIAGGAAAYYNTRLMFYTLSYSRGANNGSGVLPGSFSDNVTAAAHRQFGRTWNVSGSLNYSRTSSLPIFENYTFRSDGVAVAGQVSRGFGRHLSAYTSYTIEQQTTSGNAPALNAFSGVFQTFAFGLSYSPGAIPLRK